MSGYNPGENFLNGNFPGGISQGEFDGWEFLGREFPRGNFHRTVFLYNVSILIFQKIISKYNMAFNKKMHTLNS